LVRKNKTEGATEADMDMVIKVHNNMNENTWQQVMSWEDLHVNASLPPESGMNPKLLRFCGRPHDLSPKAWLKTLFGHSLPFDRHDWIVDRGGKEVRYVIDYYHDESAVESDEAPKHLHDVTSMKSIKVDVRPALDSFDSLMDRLYRMPLRLIQKTTSYRPLPFFPESKMIIAEKKKINQLNLNWENVQKKCSSFKIALQDCNSERSCGLASIQLQKCIGSIVCPDIVQALEESVKAVKGSDNGKTVDQNYQQLEGCLETFNLDSMNYLNKKK
jgi:hypothetical protein